MYELRLTIKMTSISLENLEDTYEGAWRGLDNDLEKIGLDGILERRESWRTSEEIVIWCFKQGQMTIIHCSGCCCHGLELQYRRYKA
jgi:hypothetical protein